MIRLPAYNLFFKPHLLGVFLLTFCFQWTIAQENRETHIRKKQEIKGGLAPKSVVSSKNGLFAAQNMMYRHTVKLFNADGEEIGEIEDKVKLKGFGYTAYSGTNYAGAPVEGVFTENGKYLWVSNYNMTGAGFENPGCDDCIGTTYDPSFVYKINTESQTIENVIEVGSVPKFLAVTPNENTLIVSNWVSSDISVIDLETEKEIKRLYVGPHPRGITTTQDSQTAFVTIMGSTKLAEVNLSTYNVDYITNLGKSPRSVLLSSNDSLLLVSLNSSNEILKYNRFTEEKVYCSTLRGPRSMVLSPNEKHLYVVNYFDDAFTKINTETMVIEAEIETSGKPIGICANWKTSEIWVACYSGKIEIYKDFLLENEMYPPRYFGLSLADLNFDVDSRTIIDTIPTMDEAPTDSLTEAQPVVLKTDPKSVSKIIPTTRINSKNTGNFHVIAGAFSISDNAANRTEELIKLGLPAQMVNGNQYTYVSAQAFESRDKAEEKKSEIAKRIPDCGTLWILEWSE